MKKLRGRPFYNGMIPWNKGKKVGFSAFKGKHHSEEAKRKLSESRKGKVNPMQGKHHTEETKLKISRANKKHSHPHTIESRKKIALAHKGEKSRFWKGGITPAYRAIRNTVEYRLWRESVFKRDNYTCIWCGQIGGRLNADHIKSFRDYPELRFAIDNGRTLCEECHKKTDNYGYPKQKNENLI